MTPDDALSRTRMATQAGVSATTLKNWTIRTDRPLETVTTVSGTQMYSWRLLLSFCQQHPELRGVDSVLARSRELFRGDDETPAPGDHITLRSALRDLRTAADRSADATVRSAKLVQELATAHAEIVAALRDAMRAYDSAMTSITAPDHLPSDFS